jgi:hypothetical protein
MTEAQANLLQECLALQSTLCTPAMRSLLEVLARDAGRYATLKKLYGNAYGVNWDDAAFDARMDAKGGDPCPS